MKASENYQWPNLNTEIWNTKDGLIYRQGGSQCLAKKWRVSPPIIEFMDVALLRGFKCLFQKNHPRKENWVPGVDYISFSRDFEHSWVFAIDQYSGRPDIDSVTFQKHYRRFIHKSGCPYVWETHGGKNIFVEHKYFEKVLDNLDEKSTHYVETVLRNARTGLVYSSKTGVISESQLELLLMEAELDSFVGMQLKNKISIRPRWGRHIPDIVAYSKRGDIVIFELKKDPGGPQALSQLMRYMDEAKRRFPKVDGVHGVLIASDFHADVVNRIRGSKEPISLAKYRLDQSILLDWVVNRTTR
jgi:hypothetical protein